MPSTKSYHLHFGLQTGPAASINNLPPLDSFTAAPHDALFTGLFLQEVAAKRYISINKAVSPYRYKTPTDNERAHAPTYSPVELLNLMQLAAPLAKQLSRSLVM